MAERATFCTQCGAKLPPGAAFCPGCGTAVDARPTVPRRSLREQLPGLVVLTVFLAVGLGIWVSVLRPAQVTPTAPRGPGGTAGAAGAPGQLPADHPPLGLPEEAKRFVEQLVAKAEAAPADTSAWKNLAQVQARAAELDPSYGRQAADSYRHVLELAPEDPDALVGLGNLYYDQRQFEAAAEQYERYLSAHPDNPNVRTDLGTTYLYARQVDRAIATYQDVIAKQPAFLQAHFNLGLAYEASGKRDQALAAIGKARELATDDATRERIARVVEQIESGAVGPGGLPGTGTPPGEQRVAGPGAPPDDARVDAGAPPAAPPRPAPGPPADREAAAAPPPAGDYRGQVEAALGAHQILGPKIVRIEWADAETARVVVRDFPMDAMPPFARNLFRGRLETILFDAKEQFAVGDERAIELVDDASGDTMERVTN